MKTFRLDCELKIWLRGVEIEAETEEGARNKFYRMTADELLEEGIIDEYTTDDVGCELIDDDEEEEDEDYYYNESLSDGADPDDFPPPPPWLW